MFRTTAGCQQDREGRQRGAAAVEFALVLPLLLSMLLGVIDFGMALGQSVSLQGAARESVRQGVTQGDVITSADRARGSLDSSKLEVKFAVDTSSGTPGLMVVCLRYPQSSVTGFYSWILGGVFEAKAVMKMETPATVTSGVQRWTGGSCAP